MEAPVSLRSAFFSPAARIAVGLVALVVSVLIITDLVLGNLSGRTELIRQIRHQISERVATQAVPFIVANDRSGLQEVLQDAIARQRELRSVAVRNVEGDLASQAGDHRSNWHPPDDGSSTLDQIRVPLIAGERPWGEVQFAFEPILPRSLGDWLTHPTLLAFALIALTCLATFYLYLRRMLEYLDPSKAIPDRVRTAFDTLTEGVLIIDKQGRTVMANRAFRDIHPAARDVSTGHAVQELDWLLAGFQPPYPWERAMEERAATQDEPLALHRPGEEEPLRLLVGCAPVLDGHKRLRGCLVSFSDVTTLHRLNDQLMVTLENLEASREEIRRQNEDLQRLATRDPMTGCLNRRAFFDGADPLYARLKAEGGNACCIMTDIDHFKSFNDRYGHAVGDQVIKAVAKSLGSQLREVDLLCRYGGEEFCILLPGSTIEQATEVAERLRASIEQHAGASVREQHGLRITSSFGVASIAQGAKDVAELIDQADNALYESKQNGRNRVSTWQGARSVGKRA